MVQADGQSKGESRDSLLEKEREQTSSQPVSLIVTERLVAIALHQALRAELCNNIKY